MLKIINELGGHYIQVLKWDDDPTLFLVQPQQFPKYVPSNRAQKGLLLYEKMREKRETKPHQSPSRPEFMRAMLSLWKGPRSGGGQRERPYSKESGPYPTRSILLKQSSFAGAGHHWSYSWYGWLTVGAVLPKWVKLHEQYH